MKHIIAQFGIKLTIMFVIGMLASFAAILSNWMAAVYFSHDSVKSTRALMFMSSGVVWGTGVFVYYKMILQNNLKRMANKDTEKKYLKAKGGLALAIVSITFILLMNEIIIKYLNQMLGQSFFVGRKDTVLWASTFIFGAAAAAVLGKDASSR